jgi:hypothetical protein
VPADLNPFFHRGPVRDPAYFFGRARETAYIVELLRAGQSVALSGQRRLGKTSLLFHLSNAEIARGHGLGPEATRWAYLDGAALDGLDEEWLYGAADRALGGEADAVPYARFVDRLRALKAENARLILLLDEFELIAANPRLGPAVFNHLRALAAQWPMQFVTASRDPLLHITFAHPDTLSSPFFNIFAPLTLPLFTEGEAAELLVTLSERAGAHFSPDVVSFILGLVGPHPLFLQVAGYRAFAVGQSSNDVRAQVQADLEQHLAYYWSNLTREAQYTLAALPLFDKESRPPAGAQLAAAGLVHNGHYLGTVLEDFVRRQQVEGLLQGGPFLLDTRRGLAAARDTVVHLTPTEFAALKLFLERPGQIITLADIEATLWPGEIAPDPERARGVIKKLRAALGGAGEAIVNRRGQGWLLAFDPQMTHN